ncbi:hypothetical protein GCM10023228_36150 [Brevibacillus fulvus]
MMFHLRKAVVQTDNVTRLHSKTIQKKQEQSTFFKTFSKFRMEEASTFFKGVVLHEKKNRFAFDNGTR